MPSSEITTHGIRVQVTSQYIEDLSNDDEKYYFFVYRVRISNRGNKAAKLLGRYWIITNEHGQTQEVRGPGVVGEQPRLEPGGSFEYTSSCPLDTALGTMHGAYQMITDDGEAFDAEIAPFTLAKQEIVFH